MEPNRSIFVRDLRVEQPDKADDQDTAQAKHRTSDSCWTESHCWTDSSCWTEKCEESDDD